MASQQQEFDDAYWASKPPQLSGLPLVNDQDRRAKLAADLATKGFQVDVPIMVWLWDAYLVMKLRADFGYTWVPAALGAPITIAPGLGAPGATPYDPKNPPAGAIRVSTNIADYPPFDPAPPMPQHTSDYVGIDELGGYFQATQAARDAFMAGKIKEGDVYELDPRGKFIFHASQHPFNPGQWALWFNKVVVLTP